MIDSKINGRNNNAIFCLIICSIKIQTDFVIKYVKEESLKTHVGIS